MVNEHLDVESHWLRHLLCFRWQHNRERERGKKAIDTEEGGEGNILNKGKTREGRKRRSRPVKDGENKGKC